MKYGRMLFHAAARERMPHGAMAPADAAEVTPGPKSRPVLVRRKRGSPYAGTDNVTIARGSR